MYRNNFAAIQLCARQKLGIAWGFFEIMVYIALLPKSLFDINNYLLKSCLLYSSM